MQRIDGRGHKNTPNKSQYKASIPAQIYRPQRPPSATSWTGTHVCRGAVKAVGADGAGALGEPARRLLQRADVDGVLGGDLPTARQRTEPRRRQRRQRRLALQVTPHQVRPEAQRLALQVRPHQVTSGSRGDSDVSPCSSGQVIQHTKRHAKSHIISLTPTWEGADFTHIPSVFTNNAKSEGAQWHRFLGGRGGG